MKQLLTFALCLMLMAMPMLALAEAAPITKDDIDAITHNSHATVQDYIDDFKPFEFSWIYEGDATGGTIFTLGIEGGSISISVTDAKNYQDDEQGLVGTAKLEGDVLQKQATLVGAYWESPAFDKLPLPRGLKLGDTEEQLQAAIGGLESASLEPGEYEDEYDETASCMLDVATDGTEWQEHYGFDFFLKEGKITQAQLWYYTDAE